MKRSKFNQILDAFDLGCSRLVSGVDDPFSQLYSISRLNKEESKLKNLCVAWVEDLTESTNKLEDIYVAKIEILEEYGKLTDTTYLDKEEENKIPINYFNSQNLFKLRR